MSSLTDDALASTPSGKDFEVPGFDPKVVRELMWAIELEGAYWDCINSIRAGHALDDLPTKQHWLRAVIRIGYMDMLWRDK